MSIGDSRRAGVAHTWAMGPPRGREIAWLLILSINTAASQTISLWNATWVGDVSLGLETSTTCLYAQTSYSRAHQAGPPCNL